MDDKVEGSAEQRQKSKTQPPFFPVPPTDPPPVSPIDGQGATHPSGDEPHHNTGAPPKDKLTKNDKVMIWLTGVIALGTLVSCIAIGLQWREMVGGGKQTDKIIKAAQINACAARQFSKSAEGINKGVSDAVLKLDAQAKVVESARKSSDEASRKALEASINNAHSGQRAYVVTTLQSDNDDPTLDTRRSGNRFMVGLHYINIGRTPAISVSVQGQLQFATPSAEIVDNLPVPELAGLDGQTLSVGIDTSEKIFTKGTDWIQDSTSRQRAIQAHNGIEGYTVFGNILYKDIFGDSHRTAFCNFYPYVRSATSLPRQCPHGNWIDNRPNNNQRK